MVRFVWRLVFTCAAHARGKAGRATKGGRNHRLCAGDGPVLDVLRKKEKGDFVPDFIGMNGDEINWLVVKHKHHNIWLIYC